MTDREMLELAAKAAGVEHAEDRFESGLSITLTDGRHESLPRWNPLDDDGAALRLAVQCEMDVFVRVGRWTEAVCPMRPAVKEPHNGDPCAATRRAIVRAAAEIGRRLA